MELYAIDKRVLLNRCEHCILCEYKYINEPTIKLIIKLINSIIYISATNYYYQLKHLLFHPNHTTILFSIMHSYSIIVIYYFPPITIYDHKFYYIIHHFILYFLNIHDYLHSLTLFTTS